MDISRRTEQRIRDIEKTVNEILEALENRKINEGTIITTTVTCTGPMVVFNHEITRAIEILINAGFNIKFELK